MASVSVCGGGPYHGSMNRFGCVHDVVHCAVSVSCRFNPHVVKSPAHTCPSLNAHRGPVFPDPAPLPQEVPGEGAPHGQALLLHQGLCVYMVCRCVGRLDSMCMIYMCGVYLSVESRRMHARTPRMHVSILTFQRPHHSPYMHAPIHIHHHTDPLLRPGHRHHEHLAANPPRAHRGTLFEMEEVYVYK